MSSTDKDDPWAEDGDGINMYSVKMAAFTSAAETGDFETLKRLLPEWSDEPFLLNEGLFLASSNGHLNCLRLLLQAGADSKYWDSKTDETVLSVAASNGHVDVLQLLINTGTDPNGAVKGDRHTPLHSAARAGKMDCLSILLDKRVFIDAQDTFGHTPLMYASKEGHANVVKALLDANANPKIKSRGRKETAFSLAVDGDKAGCVLELLLACPEEAKQQYKGGLFPLHHCVRYMKNEVACAMIDAGVDLNAIDALWSPAHLALESDNKMMLEILGACGADLNVPLPLPKEVTLLMLAVTKNKPEMVAALANSQKCNIDQFDELGRTALYHATKFGYIECLNVLLNHGADPDAYATHMIEKRINTGSGNYPTATAIHAAIMNDCPGAAIALLAGGCDGNFGAFYEEDGIVNKFTPLMVACVKSSYWAVSMLLEVLNDIPKDSYKWCLHLGPESPIFKLMDQRINRKTKSPDTLKKLCRQAIRRSLGEFRIRKKLENLDIPQALTEFILYKDLETFRNL